MEICNLCASQALCTKTYTCAVCGNQPNKSNSKWNKMKRQEIFDAATRDPSDDQESDINLYEQFAPFQAITNSPEHKEFIQHPSKLMESAVLRSVNMPRIEYDHTIDSTGVSICQLEVLMYMLNAFKTILPTRQRQGFFLGDGTGCGKGRCIASLIKNMYSKGFKKHVWVSVSHDLKFDAQRDMHDINATHIPMMSIHEKSMKDANEGVAFLSYSNLVSVLRYGQLCDWLGDDFDGVITFDEAHKGKQCTGNVSKTYLKMCELQNRYPMARIMYVSATGCSDVEHMGYMTRLGLWNVSDEDSFKQFVHITKQGGDLSNEMIAIKLKAAGLFIARTLSYKHTSSYTSVVDVSQGEYKDKYNSAAQLTRKIWESGLVDCRSAKIIFGGAILRFFKSLFITLKMNTVIDMINRVSETCAVVLTIQSTWEAHVVDDECSAPKVILLKLLDCFRTLYKENEEQLEKCDELQKEIENNKAFTGSSVSPIDTIIDTYGIDNVAEITGRKVNSRGTKRIHTNLEERNMFMGGQKQICIVSDAGSNGISLHADNKCNNKRKRFHIIVELPWSAEQFVQQCGRTHRSGQVSAPHYQIVMTNSPSECRFTSIIIQRLQSLGALTNGNKYIKTDHLQLGDHFESVEGETAVENTISQMSCSNMGLFDICKTTQKKVSKFFNRLMMLDLDEQQKQFNTFSKIYKNILKRSHNKSVKDIYNNSIKHHQTRSISDVYGIQMHVFNVDTNPRTMCDITSMKGDKMYMKNNETNTIAMALQKNVDSDIYTVYMPASQKPVTMPLHSLNQLYSAVNLDADFSNSWDELAHNCENKKSIHLITGNLYNAWKLMHNHKLIHSVKLKRLYNKSDGCWLGFHVSPEIESMLRQLTSE